MIKYLQKVLSFIGWGEFWPVTPFYTGEMCHWDKTVQAYQVVCALACSKKIRKLKKKENEWENVSVGCVGSKDYFLADNVKLLILWFSEDDTVTSRCMIRPGSDREREKRCECLLSLAGSCFLPPWPDCNSIQWAAMTSLSGLWTVPRTGYRSQECAPICLWSCFFFGYLQELLGSGRSAVLKPVVWAKFKIYVFE